jgi:hypothetical protein
MGHTNASFLKPFHGILIIPTVPLSGKVRFSLISSLNRTISHLTISRPDYRMVHESGFIR